MKNKIKRVVRRLAQGRFVVVLSATYQMIMWIEYYYFTIKWILIGKKKPNQQEIQLIKENTTFIFKSFERQKMAKRLYHNIQSYYPGVKVVIADDSATPLNLKGDNLEVIQLPFNTGLSYGLNRALEKVTTPFVIRMDDDELLTPFSRFEKQLEFLIEHKEIDLAAVCHLSAPQCVPPEKVAVEYYKQPMNYAPKALKIPHMTWIDQTHIVVGKAPNVFLARTEKMKMVGYDDNIRMIDHNEFFYRAAGNIVSVLDPTAFVFHYHNRFDTHYQKYRSDVDDDRAYIVNKQKNQSSSLPK